jgi:nitroreductase
METWQAIDSLRVVRDFSPAPIPPTDLTRILNAARRTGSSKNKQRWAFIVCRERAHLQALAGVGPYAGHLAGASLAVALLCPSDDDRWDLGRAAQNMVLAAWDRGIGSCPVTVYDRGLARELLGYPAGWDCPYLLSFGYPADPSVLTAPKRKRGRVALGDLLHDERWGGGRSPR